MNPPADVHDELRHRIRETLRPTLISRRLLNRMGTTAQGPIHVIFELNNEFPKGVESARTCVKAAISSIAPKSMGRNLDGARHPFIFAELTPDQIYDVIESDAQTARSITPNQPPSNPEPVVPKQSRAIFKVWESTPIRPMTNVSIRTVKADAAQSAFAAFGNSITWAVLDSGIQQDHSHFRRFKNLELSAPLEHRPFTPRAADGEDLNPLKDAFGHGTHVAGIIAGAAESDSQPYAAHQSVGERGEEAEFHVYDVPNICGMAPKCKLVSLRVLDDSGAGDVTAVINALEWLIQLNGDGSKRLVHGVNISAGYLPDPESYGSGQSPICRQVNRAVKSGLVVVTAAGNFGYSMIDSVQSEGAHARWDAGAFATISDPANAELAIAVGSTHRESPHQYGVSYFSSKGPTCDGRSKPDVVAPGERIISCAAGLAKARIEQVITFQQQQAQAQSATASLVPAPVGAAGPAPTPQGTQSAQPATTSSMDFQYLEDSGTSMAAPHVSGVIAAFLSVRKEYIGEPEKVAALLRSSAMDLQRDPKLQGAGLADLFRMLQSV